MLNEADIIRHLQKAFAPTSGVIGIGDDAAVLPLSDTENYVISKDILVENRHFRLSYGDAASLAHKALHVNLSDSAAMGAVPEFVMLGLALPPTLASAWVEQFLTGFAEACQKRKVQLIGGDTTASERDLFISVTVLGRAAKTKLKFRSGAKAGDVVCVAGALGEAQAGLIALERTESTQPETPPLTPPQGEGDSSGAALTFVQSKQLRPHALNAEGAWLGSQSSVTAMMDVSDGLYVDLCRMLQASGVGAQLELELLQPSAQLVEACARLNLNVRECLLTGGEDYALLITISADAYASIAQDFEKKFGYALLNIGVITETGGLHLREGGKPVLFTSRPFSHFGEL